MGGPAATRDPEWLRDRARRRHGNQVATTTVLNPAPVIRGEITVTRHLSVDRTRAKGGEGRVPRIGRAEEMATSSRAVERSAHAAGDERERSTSIADIGLRRAQAPAAVHGGPQPLTRTVSVGLLGLGRVGQAVARLAMRGELLAGTGLRLRIDAALVQHAMRSRHTVPPARVTSNPSVFLRGEYDVVIEALGGLEPARTIVSRLLGRGIPVVTANKALVASCGPHLARLAARRGTRLRFEAAALAGVPFLGAVMARPLASAAERFTAIVGGTSSVALSTLESEGDTVADAVARADRPGPAQADASRHMDGRDAADTLILLSTLLGWGTPDRTSLEVGGIEAVRAADVRIARSLGGIIRLVACASRGSRGIDAFVGPAWIPSSHPLASVGGALCGIELHGRHAGPLLFSGPGDGPDVTAAALVDGAVEALRSVGSAPVIPPASRRVAAQAPVTPWLLRASFPGLAPPASALRDLASAGGLGVEHVSDTANCEGRDARWLFVAPLSRVRLDAAVAALEGRHRLSIRAMRRLERAAAPVEITTNSDSSTRVSWD